MNPDSQKPAHRRSPGGLLDIDALAALNNIRTQYLDWLRLRPTRGEPR